MALGLTGCANRALMGNNPVAIFGRAKKDMTHYNYNGAIKLFQQLTAVYPFSPEARQAQLDLIYAYYRAGQADSCVDAANTFIRQHPAHPRVDYAWYMKGLVYFPKRSNALERLFGARLSERPPVKVRKSFDAFRAVVRQFPHSIYAKDAHQRMIYLRDRLANYNVYVARYYFKRGAYVAAARRAKLVIDNYEGAPATRAALALMILSYRQLGLKGLAAKVRKVYTANFKGSLIAAADVTPPHWWHFW